METGRPNPPADGRDRVASAQVERLRSYRVRPGRDLTIGQAIEGVRSSVRKRTRAEAEVVRAFEAVCPDDLRGKTDVERVARGTITLRCADAGARFLVDRWLRAEGEALLRAEAKAAVSRVKVV